MTTERFALGWRPSRLAARLATVGSLAAVGRELNYTRQALSMALAGKYPADTRLLRAKIVERYAGGVVCPHLDIEISPALCRDQRERPLPTAPREAVRWWQACRACPNNPDVKPREVLPR